MIVHYCDECANFRPGRPEKELCALAKKLSFKVPVSMMQILQDDWGHYFKNCKDFIRNEKE